MKKTLLLILTLALLVVCVYASAEEENTVVIEADGETITLTLSEYGFDNDEKTSYSVTADGYNIFFSGRSGSIVDNMPFQVGLVWSSGRVMIGSTFALTADPKTVVCFDEEDDSPMEDPIYIVIIPKGKEVTEGYFYVIAEEKFYEAAELGIGQ